MIPDSHPIEWGTGTIIDEPAAITDSYPIGWGTGVSSDEPATVTDPTPLAGVSVAEPSAIAYIDPIERVGYDEDEPEAPMWKQSLMMAARQGLGGGYSVGKGLTSAEPENTEAANTARYGLGHNLLMRSPLLMGGMTRLIGPRREDESEAEYLDRATGANAPIINNAVAWKNAAKKKLNKTFVRMANDKPPQAAPKKRGRLSPPYYDVAPAPPLVRGEVVLGSSSSSCQALDAQGNSIDLSGQVLDAQGNPMALSDSEEEAEDLALALEDSRPTFATAFSRDVWPSIDNQLSAEELRQTVDRTIFELSAD